MYEKLLDNLRKELDQDNRLIGPIRINEPEVLDLNTFDDDSSSSKF